MLVLTNPYKQQKTRFLLFVVISQRKSSFCCKINNIIYTLIIELIITFKI